jgi:hypothetical protein
MEIIANALQTVAANQNVYFTDEVTSGNCGILHRSDSGLVTLKGVTNQCRARYKASFGGNVAIPATGTVGTISLALAIEGEPVAATTMTLTPAAVSEFWNVYSSVFIDVPHDCCMTISVKNITTQAIEVQNANLIIERVA